MVNYLKIKPYSVKTVSKRPCKVSISQAPTLDDDNYRIYSAHLSGSDRAAGYMRCRPSVVIKGDGVVKSLYISDLHSSSQGCGIGTALLDFAQNLSRENGCGGNFHLVASGCYAPDRVPHLFYRKYGMNTGDKQIDNKIDRFIKTGKKATRLDFDEVKMFYPPVEYPKKNNIFNRVMRFVGGLFNHCKKGVAR